MIAYFDTSAIIPLLTDEPLSDLAYRLWRRASWIAAARASYVEARAGLARACRMGRITPEELRDAVEGLELVERQFHHVEITPDLVTSAGDLAEEGALRAYDAIQLAAALSLDMDDAVVVTGDRHLAAAARANRLASISDPRQRYEFGSEQAPIHEITGANEPHRLSGRAERRGVAKGRGHDLVVSSVKAHFVLRSQGRQVTCPGSRVAG